MDEVREQGKKEASVTHIHTYISYIHRYKGSVVFFFVFFSISLLFYSTFLTVFLCFVFVLKYLLYLFLNF